MSRYWGSVTFKLWNKYCNFWFWNSRFYTQFRGYLWLTLFVTVRKEAGGEEIAKGDWEGVSQRQSPKGGKMKNMQKTNEMEEEKEKNR